MSMRLKCKVGLIFSAALGFKNSGSSIGGSIAHGILECICINEKRNK